MACVLGHVFSPYLGFKGGKGIAVGLGRRWASTGRSALALLPCSSCWSIPTRYVSLGSIAAAIRYPVQALLWACAVVADPGRSASCPSSWSGRIARTSKRLVRGEERRSHSSEKATSEGGTRLMRDEQAGRRVALLALALPSSARARGEPRGGLVGAACRGPCCSGRARRDRGAGHQRDASQSPAPAHVLWPPDNVVATTVARRGGAGAPRRSSGSSPPPSCGHGAQALAPVRRPKPARARAHQGHRARDAAC